MIARELGRKEYSFEKMFEVATVAMSKVPRERMKEFLEQVQVFPKMMLILKRCSFVEPYTISYPEYYFSKSNYK